MLKQLIILAIASCFFLENIVVPIVRKSDAVYCMEETGNADTPVKEDIKKDKKEDYNINAYHKYFFISNAFNSSFHFFDEQTYSACKPEIHVPPPDAA